MELIGGALILLLFLLYLRERRRFRQQAGELLYIGEKLETLMNRVEPMNRDDQEYIRIVSDDEGVKRVAAGANRLLSLYYQERMEQERFRKNMRRMVTNISHDLKTPLTVLNGYTEILLQKASDNAPEQELRQLIRKLREKTEGVVKTVNQFFSMAKLESGDTILHPEEIDLGRLCRETLLKFYDLLEEQEFTVVLPESGKPVSVMADPDALQRILENLIENAVRYGGEGHFLAVSVCEEGENGSVCVTDHGAGITDGSMEHIFQRAYREEDRRACGGSGLGLSISRTLAERMGGELSAASRPGETVFTLRLPMLKSLDDRHFQTTD